VTSETAATEAEPVTQLSSEEGFEDEDEEEDLEDVDETSTAGGRSEAETEEPEEAASTLSSADQTEDSTKTEAAAEASTEIVTEEPFLSLQKLFQDQLPEVAASSESPKQRRKVTGSGFFDDKVQFQVPNFSLRLDHPRMYLCMYVVYTKRNSRVPMLRF
jgi:hypothetical protein